MATATCSTTRSCATPACGRCPTRARPLTIDRYAVEIPAGTAGPIAVTAAVYYQSVEAIVAQQVPRQHGRHQRQLRPRALRPRRALRRAHPAHRAGRRRGRAAGADDRAQLGDRASTAPPPTARRRGRDLPARRARATSTRTSSRRCPSPSRSRGVDARTFTLTDATGAPVPAAVDQIGPGTFGLFPHRVLLEAGRDVHRAPRRRHRRRRRQPARRKIGAGRFTIAADAEHATGNTAVPAAFVIPSQPVALTQPTKRNSHSAKGKHHGHL